MFYFFSSSDSSILFLFRFYLLLIFLQMFCFSYPSKCLLEMSFAFVCCLRFSFHFLLQRVDKGEEREAISFALKL